MPQLHSLASPRLLVTIPSHFLNLPPQNPTCKSMPQLHSLTSWRLLVTIPSHFFNLPPKTFTCKSILNFTASPLQDFWSRFQVIFKPPPQNPYMQEYSQLHSLTSPRLLVTIPSHLSVPMPVSESRFSSFRIRAWPKLSKSSRSGQWNRPEWNLMMIQSQVTTHDSAVRRPWICESPWKWWDSRFYGE